MGFGELAGCDRVVDHDRRAVLQLDLAAGDDLLAFLQAAEDGHLVAARLAGGDEGLLHHQAVARGRGGRRRGAVGAFARAAAAASSAVITTNTVEPYGL